jgi:hypothetical protein
VTVKLGNVVGMNRLSPAVLGLVIANAAVFVAGLVMRRGDIAVTICYSSATL